MSDESGCAAGFPVLVQIDTVVDDMKAFRRNGIRAQHVFFGSIGDRDHRIGIENSGPLHPGTQSVSAAKLLGLPGAHGLETMRGHHERDAVELFGEKAGHGHVPGMRVHHIHAAQRLHLGEVQAQGFQGSLKFLFGSVSNFAPRLKTMDVKAVLMEALLAPAVDVNLYLSSELAAQILDVNSGTAIDMRRIFAREKCGSQGGSSMRSYHASLSGCAAAPFHVDVKALDLLIQRGQRYAQRFGSLGLAEIHRPQGLR